MWEPCLLLSPYVFLLGLLFANQAFKALSLMSPEKPRLLDIHPGELGLPLPLKESLSKTFAFRKPIATLARYVMSVERAKVRLGQEGYVPSGRKGTYLVAEKVRT
jgi:hypothetical protein